MLEKLWLESILSDGCVIEASWLPYRNSRKGTEISKFISTFHLNPRITSTFFYPRSQQIEIRNVNLLGSWALHFDTLSPPRHVEQISWFQRLRSRLSCLDCHTPLYSALIRYLRSSLSSYEEPAVSTQPSMSFAGSESMSQNPSPAVLDHQESTFCGSANEEQEGSHCNTYSVLNRSEN